MCYILLSTSMPWLGNTITIHSSETWPCWSSRTSSFWQRVEENQGEVKCKTRLISAMCDMQRGLWSPTTGTCDHHIEHQEILYQTFWLGFWLDNESSFRSFYVLIYCLKERVPIVHKTKVRNNLFLVAITCNSQWKSHDVFVCCVLVFFATLTQTIFTVGHYNITC